MWLYWSAWEWGLGLIINLAQIVIIWGESLNERSSTLDQPERKSLGIILIKLVNVGGTNLLCEVLFQK